jgi:hypothetical protein
MIRFTTRQSMADFVKRVGALVDDSNSLPANAAKPRVTDKTGLPIIYEFRLKFEGATPIASAPSPHDGGLHRRRCLWPGNGLAATCLPA